MTFSYQVGGSLPSDAPSYIERQCDQDYYNLLYHGHYCYVFNCRQMGKSSLRVRVAQKLGDQGVHCALIDPQKIGLEVTCDKWYAGAILSITKDLGLKGCINLSTWLKERDHISPVQRFAEFIETVVLKEIQAPIVIFVEEIDRLLSLSFGMEDFFGLIRSWSEDRSNKSAYKYLTVTFLGVATPNDLFRSRSGSTFNIGTAVEMTGFTVNEARFLAKGLAGKVPNPQAFLEAAVEWTGGQPFLLQKVLKLISQELNHSDPSTTDIFSWLEGLIQDRIVNNWESHDVPPHLRTIRDRVLSVEEKMRGSLLGEYQQILLKGGIIDKHSEEHAKLRLTGLAVQKEGILRSYNLIYAQVFDQNWVQQELDNLRPSFYAEAFRAWQENTHNESFLLRGDALKNAKIWARGKRVSEEDILFLTNSQEVEEAAQIEANRILQKARDQAEAEQQKANQMLQDLRDQAEVEQQQAESNLGEINKEVAQLRRQRRRLRWTTYVIATGSTLSLIALIILQVDVRELEKTRDNLKEEQVTLKAQKVSLQDENTNLSAKNRTLAELNNTLKDEKINLQEERNLLKVEKSTLVIEKENLKEDKINLEKQTKNLREQNNQSNIELSLSRINNLLLSYSNNDIVSGLVLALKTFRQAQVSNSRSLNISLESLHDALETSREFNRIDPFLISGIEDTQIKIPIVPLAYIHNNLIFAAQKEDRWYLYRWDEDHKTRAQILNSPIDGTKREPFFSIYQDFEGKMSILVISQNKIFITDGNHISEDSSINDLIQPGLTTAISSSQDGHVVAARYADGTIAARRREAQGHFSSILFPEESCSLAGVKDYIAVSPDGKAIVSSDGTKLKVWTEQNGSCQFLPDIPSITSLSIHPNSQTLFLGVENGYIYIFPNIENPSSEKFIFFGRHEEEINALLVLNEGKLLASSSDDGTIKLWDIDVGDQGYKKSDPIMNLRGHQAAVFNIIPGREKNLISGGLDGTIRFWDLDTIPSNLGIQEGVSRACDRLKQHPQGIEVQQICEEFWISFSIPGISGF